MRKTGIEFIVGIFVLLGIAALVVLAVQVSGARGAGGPSYRVEARFDNIGGLNAKAPVMIGGVRVGRVGAIWLDPDEYVAVVGLDIDSKYANLSDDTGAAILTAGLLGSQYIGLSPGGSDFYLRDGDRIDITQSAIQLESLIGQFMFNQDGGDEAQ